MKLRMAATALAVCLLLTGCASWMDGQYHWKEPHLEQGNQQEQAVIQVADYTQMCRALEDMVESAVESATLSVENYDSSRLEANLELAVRHIKGSFPMGAYAVEDIHYEIGTTGGGSAVAVTIAYNYNRSVIPKIKQAGDMAAAKELIATALNTCETSLVMQVENYETTDYLQVVRDYAQEYPSLVMEVPQVIANEYPSSGDVRVVELQFTYQSSRETLQTMLGYVQPVFASATLYVSGEEEQSKKFDQLYSFLMERNDYTVETSVTPSYSLLRHGVGDSKAFATVYAAMCRRAGLECLVISGTKNGEAWFWNIICEDGTYYHVDLLGSHGSGAYQKLTDDQMAGYVWDYSAYPVCGITEEADDGAV